MPPPQHDPSKGTSFLDLSPPRNGIGIGIGGGNGLLKPPTLHALDQRSYSLPLPRPPSREGKTTTTARNKLRKKTSRLFGLSLSSSSPPASASASDTDGQAQGNVSPAPAQMLRNHSAPGAGSSKLLMVDQEERRSSASSAYQQITSSPTGTLPQQALANDTRNTEELPQHPSQRALPLPIPLVARTLSTDVQSLASTSTSGSGSGTSVNPPPPPPPQAIGTRMSSWFNNFLSQPNINNPVPQRQTQEQTRRLGRGEALPAAAAAAAGNPSSPMERESAEASRRSPIPRRSSSRSGRSSSNLSGNTSVGREERERVALGTAAPAAAIPGGGGGAWTSRRREWRKSVVSSSEAGSTSSIGTGTTQQQHPPAALPRPITTPTNAAQPSHSFSGTSTSTSNTAPSNLINSMTNLLSSARTKALTSYRSLVDSEASPDGSTDPIWVRGVRFPADSSDNGGRCGDGGDLVVVGKGKAPKSSGRRGKKVSDGFTGAGAGAGEFTWPAGFLLDFQSTVWCTYRSQYAPILAFKQGEEIVPSPRAYMNGHLPPLREGGERRDAVSSAARPLVDSATKPIVQGHVSAQAQGKSSAWSTWMSNISSVNITGGGGSGSTNGEGTTNERGLTADSGWGCMLRTGQSLLANALVCYHLGRDWRLPDTLLSDGPPLDSGTIKAKYTTYIQILSWFLDDPSPVCPFSVHRMALVGKQLGKEVGEWFGPSTAAGAVKTLANGFPLCGLSIVTAVDSTIYASEVIEASHQPLGEWQDLVRTMPVRSRRGRGVADDAGGWGEQGVLILAGVRLGMEGVNPLYHDSIKALFTFPQSVGIAGGRPGSSYYFIGCQADNLFYLDPHLTRPAIPLKTRTEEREPSDPSHATRPAHNDNWDDSSAQMDWLLNVYTSDQLKTFHCDKVKKMPISSLDPSMLIGFLCKDNDDWLDLRERLNNLPHRIISIENTVPTWNDDSDDPDIESFTDTDVEEDSFDAPSSPSTVALEVSPSHSATGNLSAELDSGVEYESGDEVVLAAPGTGNLKPPSNEQTDTESPHLVLLEPSPPPTPTLSASQRRHAHPSDSAQPAHAVSSATAIHSPRSDPLMEESFESVDVPLPTSSPASSSQHRSNSSGNRTVLGKRPVGPGVP